VELCALNFKDFVETHDFLPGRHNSIIQTETMKLARQKLLSFFAKLVLLFNSDDTDTFKGSTITRWTELSVLFKS
jgi:hypothetical protein